jgi:FkbM family methyltransferase
LLNKGRKLLNILRSSPFRSALWKGTAAAVEHGPLLRTLTCNTVVDVGANRGQFAVVAHECFPEATIFSFEPLSGAAQIFRRVLGEAQLVHFQQHAIGPNASWGEIHISERDDSSSMLPIGALHAQIFPGTTECRREQVRVERLDSVLGAADLRAPALLKIDVEGFELEVLKGCGDLLGLFSYVYVEASFVQLNEGQPLADEVIDYLRTRGFRIRGIFNVSYDRDGRSVQADFLFAKHVERNQ